MPEYLIHTKHGKTTRVKARTKNDAMRICIRHEYGDKKCRKLEPVRSGNMPSESNWFPAFCATCGRGIEATKTGYRHSG